jgi:hypothetical protein
VSGIANALLIKLGDCGDAFSFFRIARHVRHSPEVIEDVPADFDVRGIKRCLRLLDDRFNHLFLHRGRPALKSRAGRRRLP